MPGRAGYSRPRSIRWRRHPRSLLLPDETKLRRQCRPALANVLAIGFTPIRLLQARIGKPPRLRRTEHVRERTAIRHRQVDPRTLGRRQRQMAGRNFAEIKLRLAVKLETAAF